MTAAVGPPNDDCRPVGGSGDLVGQRRLQDIPDHRSSAVRAVVLVDPSPFVEESGALGIAAENEAWRSRAVRVVVGGRWVTKRLQALSAEYLWNATSVQVEGTNTTLLQHLVSLLRHEEAP